MTLSDDTAPAKPLSRQELEAKIVALAWADDEFRRKFIADPKGQFEAHLGTKLPESLTMTVHEETPDSLHFVIPTKPAGNLSELSDEDLEKIAGGVDVVVTAFSLLAVSAVSAAAAGSVNAIVRVVSDNQAGWNARV
jgi:hypothetical protein